MPKQTAADRGNENGNVKELQPSQPVLTARHSDLKAPYIAPFEPFEGEYHLVEIKNGIEVPGSDFSVGETNYRLTYAKNPNFIVKKNPS